MNSIKPLKLEKLNGIQCKCQNMVKKSIIKLPLIETLTSLFFYMPSFVHRTF